MNVPSDNRVEKAAQGCGEGQREVPAANLDALRDLLRRVESATEGSKALDCDITVALGIWSPPRDSLRDTLRGDVWQRQGINHYCPHLPYSSSLDAALALVERVLPGWRWMVRRVEPNEIPAFVSYVEQVWGVAAQATGRSPPLALLSATLRGLALLPADQGGFLRALDTQSQQDEPTSKVGSASAHPRRSGHQCPNQIQTQDVEKPSHG